MSLFYQIMGTTKCPRIKKHPGLKTLPISTKHEPNTPGYLLLYICETTESKQSIKCLEDGRWSESPYCPDPTNFTCPDPGHILHGNHNGTGTYKVGTVIQFKCQNEPTTSQTLSNITADISQQSAKLLFSSVDGHMNSNGTLSENQLPTTVAATMTADTNMNEVDTITTLSASTTAEIVSTAKLSNLSLATPIMDSNRVTIDPSILVDQLQSPEGDHGPIRYNLTGQRYLKCLASSRWNHPNPVCSPILPEEGSNLKFFVTSALVILVPILILIIIAQLFIKWKRRQQQRARWKQYFTDYKYRHSKSSIAFGMKPLQGTSKTSIPVTDL